MDNFDELLRRLPQAIRARRGGPEAIHFDTGGNGGAGGSRGGPGRGGHGPGYNNGARPRREGGLDGQDVIGQWWRAQRGDNYIENRSNDFQERGRDGQDLGQRSSQRGGNYNENRYNHIQEHGLDGQDLRRGRRGGNYNDNRSNDSQERGRNRNQGRGQRGRHSNQNTGNDGPERPNNNSERDNNNSERRNNGPRRERTMGFQYVQNLVDNPDLQQVMFEISDDKKGFNKLLDSKDLSNDLIVLLVKLIRNVCDSTFQSVKLSLLNAALTSRFMEKLIVFITGIASQTDRDKRFNKHLWNDPDEFWNALLDISKTVQELTPTNGAFIKKLLKTMTVFFPLIESEHSMHISDSIKAKTLSLCELVEKTINDLEVKKQRALNNIPTDDDLEPPDDFHEIPVIPSVLEVVTEDRPFLRANIVDKAFKSINDYLDIQFRLLREDFVAPLRRGICTYLRNQNLPKNEQKKLDSIKTYNPIRFVSVETVNECNCYKMRFDFSKKKQSFTYENSKKLMFGSLVCFTNDNFQSLLFGKIVQRDVKLLEAGLLIVGFQEEVQVNFETDYLMVESSVYFEPYYQVLNVLKLMKTDSFPMERYIINVETGSRPPEYLWAEGQINYTVESNTFFPLNFPQRRFYSLNDSQLNAYKAALTDEFCIIQGPPGTGKTYLGLKIAHTLLQNSHAWYRETPILVICFTNHALDQFLEGLLPVTQNILRVGGQSKNETLQQYNLNVKRSVKGRQGQHAAVSQKKRAIRDYVEQSKTLNNILSEIDANETILNFDCFQNIDDNFKDSWFDNAEAEDIRKWLLEGKTRRAVGNRNNRPKEPIIEVNQAEVEQPEDFDEDNDRENECLDDIFNFIVTKLDRQEHLIKLQHLREKLDRYYEELERLKTQPRQLEFLLHKEKIELEVWETETDLEYLSTQMEYYNDRTHRRRPRDIDFQNPFNMNPDKRWELYYYWLDLYANYLRKQYENKSEAYRTLYREYSQLRDMEDTQLMTQHLVVGMTTTGAARLQSSLQALKSPIVIVEEAAEVLEAHIVAALTKHCQHLILIGDHLQLKPGAADYNIETKFKLGISLFERMVKNNIKCHTLNVQHRMRPEISKLIKPHIYRDLLDHESTLQRNPITGVEKCLYFIDHREPENTCQDSSKKNTHEAKFLIALARHLILNGYKPEQITILAAYLGQLFEMMREKKKDENKLLLQDVRISVLDNYQGEESDIILLSLVRSNSENKAGFLRIQNRVCVALSRARNGFYIMGNMSLLLKSESENKIWEKVKAVLEEQNAIGPHLNLRCQVHRHRLTSVRFSKDFVKLSEGGCDLLCEARVGCGHICKRLCHVQDRDHQLYKCNERCGRLLCNDFTHKCPKLCYQECGPCMYPVTRKLYCGHVVSIACHVDPTKYKCQVPVLTRLPCDHDVLKPCSQDAKEFLCPTKCDTRVEPCGHACSRLCHIRVDPDHLEYNCQELCAKPRQGCRQPLGQKHICPNYCYEECEECTIGVNKAKSCGHWHTLPCKEDVEQISCQKPCNKKLICGHPCVGKKCFENCGACQKPVPKIIPDCGHPVKIKCHEAPERRHCISKTCSRLLPCGHNCKEACKATCTQQCMEIVDCNIRTPCGHIVKKIMCHLRFTTDPKLLLKYCTEPCREELNCKTRDQAHTCSGTCGECMQGRIHKRCNEKCGVPLVCNHECPIPCRQACKPCTMPCQMKCAHNKCKKKCGEPCTPCQARCNRRCEHVRCNRACGEICSVGPCKEICPKIRKCGHPCVGFCGDPCPSLCRVCDHEELTEIFMGFEDEEDAIFVQLKDCGHVLENTGLEDWLSRDGNQIAFKTCPRCRTNISSTERFSDYIKQSIDDVRKAKEKSFGISSENEHMRAKLSEELLILKEKCPYFVTMACRSLRLAIDTLLNRLKPVRGNRRQPINQVELNAIKSKTQTLSYIIQCFKDVKKMFKSDDASIEQLTMLLEVLLRSEDHVTHQEVKDLESEIKRLHRLVQYDNIHKSVSFQVAITKSDVLNLRNNIRDVLFLHSRYTDFLDNWIKPKLTEFASKVDGALTISDAERIEIVQAMQLSQGHWYKCPNGHPYTIGECGGAMQIAKCFCGAQIGGTNHALLRDNALAGEMDGATRSAWPGRLY